MILARTKAVLSEIHRVFLSKGIKMYVLKRDDIMIKCQMCNVM